MYTVSVIVPVYNAEKYIETCISSVLNQTFTDFELILIDDGSEDESGHICDEYATKDTRIRVFHKENGGPSAARNSGLNVAQGEWILFLDSDDWIVPESLQLLMSEVVPETAIIQYLYEDGQKGIPQNQITEFRPKDAFARMMEGTDGLGYIWNKLYRRRVIKEIRFDERFRMSEDILFNAEIFHTMNQNQRIQLFNRVLYVHTKNPCSLVNNARYISRFSDMIKVMEQIRERFMTERDVELNKQLAISLVEIATLCLTRLTVMKTQEIPNHIIFYQRCIKKNYLTFFRTSRTSIVHKLFVWMVSRNAVLRTLAVKMETQRHA